MDRIHVAERHDHQVEVRRVHVLDRRSKACRLLRLGETEARQHLFGLLHGAGGPSYDQCPPLP